MRPGLLDPGPFYDHHHHGPSGPLMQPPLAGMTVTSRYKCRVGRIAATRHATSTLLRRVEVQLLYKKTRYVLWFMFIALTRIFQIWLERRRSTS